MPFREDIDVTPYLAQLGIADHGLVSSVIRIPGVESSQPYLAGDGAATASTCTDLQPYPPLIWDVNGYYRMFGITWPYRPVTKAQLRQGAMELFEREGQSRLATYALQLLLHDTPERRDYLSHPLGRSYLDRFTMDALWGMAAEVAGLMSKATGTDVTRAEVMESWGLQVTERETGNGERLVPEEPVETDISELNDATLSEVSATQSWDWSFYVQTAPRVDLDDLKAWQELLVSVLAHMREIHDIDRLAVGVAAGKDWRWNVEAINGDYVFLRNADIVLTVDDAFDAVSYVIENEELQALRDAQRGI